ncbi:MAG: sigma-70 family RNA polymerase sigma factor [Bacilli bacterium]|nr:sigma-70 family RNA polymerase sigma factor [Bacilli bacterium]
MKNKKEISSVDLNNAYLEEDASEEAAAWYYHELGHLLYTDEGYYNELGRVTFADEENSRSALTDTLKHYLKSIRDYDILEKDEQIRLAVLARVGNQEAKDRLIKSNLKIVVGLAFKGKSAFPKIDVMDLIQSGNLGLLNALEYYDPEQNVKFSTFATYWVKKCINDEIADRSQITVPQHTRYICSLINKQRVYLTQELGRIPTDEEVIASMVLTHEQEVSIKNIMNSVIYTNKFVSIDGATEKGTPYTEIVCAPGSAESSEFDSVDDVSAHLFNIIKTHLDLDKAIKEAPSEKKSTSLKKKVDVLRLFLQGMSDVDISKKFGCSRQYIGMVVQYWAKRIISNNKLSDIIDETVPGFMKNLKRQYA